MKFHPIIGSGCVMLLSFGCSVREVEAEKPKRDREVQARAEAARKEMEALPKVFRTPDYFKKYETDKKAVVAPAQK